jgi:hypothetical protein
MRSRELFPTIEVRDLLTRRSRLGLSLGRRLAVHLSLSDIV